MSKTNNFIIICICFKIQAYKLGSMFREVFNLLKKILLLFTGAIIIVGLTGCLGAQKDSMEDIGDDEIAPVSSIMLSAEEAQKINDKVPLYLYFIDSDTNKLRKEIRYVPMDEAKKSAENLATCVVTELINGPSKETGLKSTIPQGTALKNQVKIDKRTAILDLSKEFVDNHPGGKDMEELTIYSVCNSLTEIKEIDKVKFLIEGKAMKDFKGSFKFDAEFPRNDALIYKGGKAIENIGESQEDATVIEEIDEDASLEDITGEEINEVEEVISDDTGITDEEIELLE